MHFGGGKQLGRLPASRLALASALLLVLVSPAFASVDPDGKGKGIPAWAQEITWKGKKAVAVRDQIIVKFREGVSESRRKEAAKRHDLGVLSYSAFINAYLLSTAPGRDLAKVLEKLASDPDVEYAEPNFVGNTLIYATPDDYYYQRAYVPGYGQWPLVVTETDKAWNDPDVIGSKGDIAQIGADVDTGVDYNHEDFNLGGGQYRILTSPTGTGPFLGANKIVGWDFYNNDNNPMDDHGHGTHTTGTIGAVANNTKGIAGMSWFPKLMPVKVCSPTGGCPYWDIIQGIGFSVDNGANVISMSLGGYGGSSALHNAIIRAWYAGVVVVAAAGNDNTGTICTPAAYPECISVAASTRTDGKAYFSNYGAGLEVMAPGCGPGLPAIFSTLPGNQYDDWQGTSMATPHVSGLALLVFSQNPDWAPETVYRRITRTADKVTPYAGTYDANGWNQYAGYGRINTYQALGGLAEKSWYVATAYLRDSRTIPSDPAGTTPVFRHWFKPATPGTVTFNLLGDDRDVVDIVNAEVRVRDRFGAIVTVPLTANPITSRLAKYEGTLCAPLEFAGTKYETAVPDAYLTDNAGKVTHIPLPDYVPATGTPATVSAVASPNPAEAGTSTTITVVVKDAAGNPIYGVPVKGYLVAVPGGGAVFGPSWGRTAGCPPGFDTSLLLSLVEGRHLLVFTISATGYTGIWTSLTVTGMAPFSLNKSVEPAPACAGNILSYTISWSTAGSSTIADLTIIDTLPAGLSFLSPSLESWMQDDAFGTPRLTASSYAASVAGPWTAGEPPDGAGPALVLRWVVSRVAPGKSGYLRFHAAVSPATPPATVITNRASASVPPTGKNIVSGSASMTTAAPGTLEISGAAPQRVSSGRWFTVIMTVTNNGADTTVTPGMTLSAGAGLVESKGAPGPVFIPTGGTQVFSWTFSSSGSGVVFFDMTASGSPCTAGARTVIQRIPTLEARLDAFPIRVNTGQDFLLILTVTNTGEMDADMVDIAGLLLVGLGGVIPQGGPAPAMPSTLAGGAWKCFTWTYTGNTVGTVEFSTTVIGKDADTGYDLAAGPVVSPVVTIEAPALLEGSPLTAIPDPVCQWGLITVTMTATNWGGASANNIATPPLFVEGTGSAALVTAPASIPSLPGGGMSADFTWVYRATSPGTVKFTATVTATDANSGAPLGTGPQSMNAITVLEAGSMEVSVNAPAKAYAGQLITIAVTATNTGASNIDNVIAAIQFNRGGAIMDYDTGPVPPSVPSLAPAAAQTFFWTYSVSGSGIIELTATVSGTHPVTTCPVEIATTVSVTAFLPATLETTLTFNPNPVTTGGVFLATLTVRNIGDVPATGVMPALEINSGGGLVTPGPGPLPAGPVTLAPGAAQPFVWAFNAVLTGSVEFTGTATGIDSASGNPLVSASTGVENIVTAGVPGGCISVPQVWWERNNPVLPTSFGLSYDIAAGPLGSWFVAGEVDYQATVAKYDRYGALYWTFHYDASPDYDYPYAIATDSSGNSYAAGELYKSLSSDYDAVIRKLDASGNEVWKRTYDSPSGDWTEAWAVGVDASGNVFVGGSEIRDDLGESYNWFVRKYDKDGNFIWHRDYSSVGYGADVVQDIAVDSSGNVIVTGSGDLAGAFGFWPAFLTRKYDNDGTLIWSRTTGYPLGVQTYPRAVCVDSSGNITVGGTWNDDTWSTGFDWLVERYDANGNHLWSRTFSGVDADVGEDLDEIYGLAADPSGNVVAAGRQDGTGINGMWKFIKYDTAGGVMWSFTHTASLGFGSAYGVAINSSGAMASVGVDWDDSHWYVKAYDLPLGGSLDALPNPVAPAQPFTVTMTVTNTACEAVSNVKAELIVNSGAGLVGYVSGPSPASIPTLASGQAATFSWTYNAVSPGTAYFSATVEGAPTVSGGTALAVAGDSILIASGSTCPASLVWTRTYNGAANGNDQYLGVAVDSRGYATAAGSQAVAGQGLNWLVRQYDPAGNVVWTQAYNGAANSTDDAGKVVVDASDNVIVIGREFFLAGDSRQMLRKYNSAGTVQWTSVWNGPAAGDTYGEGVEVDSSGNIFTVGWDQYGPNSMQWVIQKYSAAGGLLWSRTWRGDSSTTPKYDRGYYVAVDPTNGDLLVAGGDERRDINQSYNAIIQRYDTNGALKWSRTFYSVGNYGDGYWGVATDSAGNAIAVGQIERPGPNIDSLFQKWSPAGILLWSFSIDGEANGTDGALSVKVLPDDSFIVSGFEMQNTGQQNWVIWKFMPDGTMLWKKSLSAPPLNDAAWDIARDGSGNIYVAGYFDRTDLTQAFDAVIQKYSSGNPLEASLAPVQSPVNLGQAAHLVMTVTNVGCEQVDNLVPTIAAGPGGALVSLTGGPTPASVAALAVGAAASFTWDYSTLGAGTVTFTATATGTPHDSGGTATAYASAQLDISSAACLPQLAWAKTYNGPAGGADFGQHVTMCANGDIVVSGFESVAGQDHNWLIRRYDSAGNIIWNKTYNGAANGRDEAVSVDLDGSGNVIVAGWSVVVGQGNDCLLRKYDGNGNFIWGVGYNSPANSNDSITGMSVDSFGNIFTSAEENRPDLGEWVNWRISKYDGNGSLLWSRTHNGPANGNDEPYGGRTDHAGNFIAIGYDRAVGTIANEWVIKKYDTNGNLLWTRTYNGPTANGDDAALDVVADSADNLYVTGVENASVSGQGSNLVLLKYDSAGNFLWKRTYNGASNGDDWGEGVDITPDGLLLVSGFESVAGQAHNLLLLKYDSAGTQLWKVTYNDAGNRDDAAVKVAAGFSHDIYAIGYEDRLDLGQDWNFLLRKYIENVSLTSSLAAVPSTVPIGDWTSLVFTVSNTGCNAIVNVTPTIFVGSGTGQVEYISGPTPASIASIAPWGTGLFTWTFSASGAGTVVMTATATGTDSVLLTPVSTAASATIIIPEEPKRILFYGPTAGGHELTTPGITLTIWDEATWATKTTADFASFDAIVFGDIPACHASATYWDVAVATRNVWGPAVTGNVIVIGASPDAQGKSQFAHDGVLYAAAGGAAPGPGLYVSLSCVYETASVGPVDLLAGIGDFTAGDIGAPSCVDSIHRTAMHPLLAAETDAALSNWNCSAREGIYSWPEGYTPFAIARYGTVFTDCDGVTGTPTIVVSNAIAPCPAPALGKLVEPGDVACSNPLLTYTVTFSNAGSASVGSLTITDSLPNGTSYVKPSLAFWAAPDALGTPVLAASAWASSLTGPWTSGEPPNGSGVPLFMRWVVNRVMPGMSGYLRFQALVSSTLTEDAYIYNSVSATQAWDSRVYLSGEAVAFKGSILFTKTATASAVKMGDTFTYSVMLGNSCNETLYNLTIWDTLPAGVTFVSTTGGGSYDGTKVVWTVPQLVQGDSVHFEVSVVADGTIAPIGPNVARVTGYDYLSNPLPVRMTNSVWVDGLWGIPIVHKSMPPPPVCMGSRVTWTLSWSNAGICTVDNLTFTDTLPNGTAYAAPSLEVWAQSDGAGNPSVTASAATGWGGPWTPGEPADGTGVPLLLRWVVDRVAPGKSGFIRFGTDVSATLAGLPVIVNQASATSMSDPWTHMTEEVSAVALPAPVLVVTKTHAPAVPFASGPVTYTILVTNAGQATATSILIVDTLSAHVTYLSQTFKSDDPKAKVTWNGLTVGALAWSGTITLGPGYSATVTIGGRRDACYADLITNTAYVAAGSPCGIQEYTDVDDGFNMPTLSFSLLKTPVPASPANGGQVRYRITLTNNGAATITNVLITDTLPAEVDYLYEWHTAPLAFALGSGNLCIWSGAPSPALAPGKSLTVTVTGVASLCYAGPVSNTAWALGRNTCINHEEMAPAFFDLTAPVLPSITIVKTHAPVSPRNGGIVSYRITVNNVSSATLTYLSIVDTFPAEFTATGEQHPAGLTFTNLPPTGALWEGAVSVKPGKPLSVTLTGTLALCYAGNISNTAAVVATATCAQTTGSAVDGFDLLPPVPDLVISKDTIPAVPANGAPFKYRIIMTNLGLATINGILVTDTIPAEVNFASEVHPAGWTFVNTGGALSWSGAVTMGFGKSFTITVTGGASLCYVGTVSNTAWALGTYSCGVTEKSAGAFFDLAAPVMPSITARKSFSPARPAYKVPVTYQLVVTNNGLATLTDLLVTDTLPASVAFVSEAHPAGLTFSNSSGLVSWAGPVSVAPAKTLTITVTGTNLCYTGSVSNSAWVVASNACGSDSALSATAYDIVTPLPAFSVAKVAVPAAPKNGDIVRYRIVVTNTNAATITDVSIADTLPGEFLYLSEAHPAGMAFTANGSLVSWDGSGLVLGPGKALTVTATGVASWCLSGSVSNTAWAYAGNACAMGEGIDEADFTLSTPVVPSITVAKAFTPAAPLNGAPVTYRITVVNASTGTVTSVLITDTLPGVVSYLSEAHPAGLSFASAGSVLSWSGAVNLGPGKGLTVSVTGRNASCFTGLVSNTAWAGAGSLCGGAEAIDEASYNLAMLVPALTIAKTATPAAPKNGDIVRYRIVVTNSSAATVMAMHIVDTLPAAGFDYLGEAHPASLAFTPSGNILSWDDSGLTLSPGKSLTVTVTGVASWCYAGPVSNTAWVFGGNPCGMDEGIAEADFTLSTPVVPAITVAKSYSPNVQLNTSPVAYRITVTNTSKGTVTDVLITDTLPVAVIYGSEAHPAGLSFASVGGVLSWSGAVNLGPGKGLTVSVTGQNLACWGGRVSNTAWAWAGSLCGPAEGYSATAYDLVPPTPPSITVRKTYSPASQASGGPVTYRITVTNASTGTMTSILVTDTLPSAVTYGSEAHPAGLAFANVGGILSWAGAATLGPGKTFTMTVNGTNDLCTPGIVSNTAWAHVDSVCGTAEGISSTAYGLVPPAHNISLALNALPAAPKNGDIVRYRVVVTNTGGGTVTTLAVADTLPAGFSYLGEEHPAGLNFTSAGSLLAWDGAALVLGPGRALTITVTGVASWCYVGPVSNTAWAYGVNGCATAERTTAAFFDLTAPAVTPITVAKTYSPANPVSGGPVSFRIVVTNAGTGTVTSLAIVDTLQAEVAYGSEQHPAGLNFTSAGGVLAWNGAALALGPGRALTVTVSGTNLSCYTGLVSNTAWAGAGSLCGASEGISATTYRVTAGTVNIAARAFLQPLLSLGQSFTVTLTVTNTAASDVNGLTPFIDINKGALLVNPTAGPVPANIPLLAAGSSATFTWTYSALNAGWVSFTATALGTTCGGTAVIASAPGVSATIQTAASLAAALAALPPRVNVSQPFLLTLTVTNSGQALATGVNAAAFFKSWPGDVTQGPGPNPALPVAIPGLSSLTFTWTFTGTTPGLVVITTTVTGTDANSLAPLTTGAVSATVIVETPAVLVASLAALSQSVCTGRDFLVTLTVTNTGMATANGVTAPTPRQSGTGGAAPVLGPAPSLPVTLTGGMWRVFTWTMTGSVPGTFDLSTTVTGTDANSGAGLTTGVVSSTPVTVSTPGALAVQASSPRRVSVGQVFTVDLTVTNTGGTAVANLTAAAAAGPGSALMLGPSALNPGPVTLAALAWRTFSWSCTATAAGVAVFSATAWGDTCAAGTALAKVAIPLTTTIMDAAFLNASAALYGTTICAGSDFLVTLTVTNSGGAPADAVMTEPFVVAGNGGAAVSAGPYPAQPLAALPGGAPLTFTWTMTALTSGVVEFSTTVRGTDDNSGMALAVGPVVAGSATILASGALNLLAFTNPSPVLLGRPFTVTLYVENVGTQEADLLVPSMAFSSGASLVHGTLPASPPNLATLAAGTATAFIWSYTATGTGTVNSLPAVFVYTCPGPTAISLPFTFDIINPVSLKARLVVIPDRAGVDEIVRVEMVVTSIGVLPVNAVTPSALTWKGTGQVEFVSGPSPARRGVLDPGESFTFKWTYRTLRGGNVEFDGSVSGVNGIATANAVAAPGLLVITEAKDNLDDMIVYPNPFDPNKAVGGVVKFRRMVAFTRVALYTVAGEPVKTVEADLNGLAVWDGRNGDGTGVTPGIYFYVAQSPKGHTKRGKLQVMR